MTKPESYDCNKFSWALIIGVSLALSTSAFLAVSVQNIFPYLAGSLAISDHHAVWILTFMVMNWAIGSTLMPWTTARIGIRSAFNISVLTLIVSSIFCATTSNIWVMLVFRGIQGIGAGLLVPLSQTIFLRCGGGKDKTLMMSLWTNAMLIPFYMGPFIGGWLSQDYSWRYIFIISVPILVLSIFVCNDHFQISEIQKIPFDLLGFISLYVFVTSLQYIIDKGIGSGWFSSKQIDISAVFALIFALLFFVRQRTYKYPLLDLSFFHLRNYGLGMLFLCIGWSMFTGWTADIPLWIEKYSGYNGFYGGLLSVPTGLTAIPLTIMMSRVHVHISLKYLSVFSLVAFGIIYFYLFLSPYESLCRAMTYMAMLGIGIGLLFVPLNMLVMEDVEHHRLHDASTLANFIRTLTSSMGVGILGGISYNETRVSYASLRGHDPVIQVLTGAMSITRYHDLAISVAATDGINYAIRISSFICFISAIIAVIFVKNKK